jgi:hypothetical protein
VGTRSVSSAPMFGSRRGAWRFVIEVGLVQVGAGVASGLFSFGKLLASLSVWFAVFTYLEWVMEPQWRFLLVGDSEPDRLRRRSEHEIWLLRPRLAQAAFAELGLPERLGYVTPTIAISIAVVSLLVNLDRFF